MIRRSSRFVESDGDAQTQWLQNLLQCGEGELPFFERIL